MNPEKTRNDIRVAAAAAGCTIAVSVIVEYVLTVEASALLQLSPLAIYFLYLVGHERLPDGVVETQTWVALTALVAIGAVLVAIYG